MIPTGVVLLAASSAMAVAGLVAYLLSRDSAGRSRGAAIAVFGHGAIGTAGLLMVGYVVHVHALASVHVHSIGEVIQETFLCDLEWSCAASTAGGVAATVILASFLLSQLVARTVVRRALLKGASVSDLTEDGRVRLFLVPDPRPDAFSVALLALGGLRVLRAQDCVVITTGMMDLLTADEQVAVLEHELAHVRSRDDRYLPYFHALASIVFFDPFLRRLRDRIRRRYELEADDIAVRRTRRPRTLARALLKVYEAAAGSSSGPALLGHPRRHEILERIDRLLVLADRMDAGEA